MRCLVCIVFHVKRTGLVLKISLQLFESGNLLNRAKALVPILVPLFISAFRRADELATAMECRCYHGGEGRTKLHVLKYQRRDYVALAGGAVILALVVVLRRLGA